MAISLSEDTTFKITHMTEAQSISVPLAGSAPLVCENSGSLQQQETSTMMKRNDNYLPVPEKEKTPEVDFVNNRARSNESIVRNYLFSFTVPGL